MKPSKVVPKSFVLSQKDIDWARKYAPWLDLKEQEERWRDHEYKRTYTHFNLCWRNWIRKAAEINPCPPSYRETVIESKPKYDRNKAQQRLSNLRLHLR